MLRLAIELQAIHVDPGRIVALYFEKFVWAKVAMSGVLRAGAALSIASYLRKNQTTNRLHCQTPPIFALTMQPMSSVSWVVLERQRS